LSDDIYDALARTALLLERDVFVGADCRGIVDGLRGTTARIVANRSNVDTAAGQTALVTLYGQLAMMGLQIDLDIPAIGLVSAQPPLRGTDIGRALVDYSDDLLPGGSSRPTAAADITFALGDTPAPAHAVRVGGTDWQATVGVGARASAWRGVVPVGAMAAAAAAAPDGLRVALSRIAEHLDIPAPGEASLVLDVTRQVSIDLSNYAVDGPVRLDEVDCVSGGAITNAALYVLLRLPRLTGHMRITEPDILDYSNLNRYSLARRSQVRMRKAAVLEGLSTDGFEVSGLPVRFDDASMQSIGSIAPRVLVGVDHIPSRWFVQAIAPESWICIGASSHFFVLVSTHPSGGPCAGCVHPKDDAFQGDVPTISFVSFWAGLLQGLELIREAAGAPNRVAKSVNVWPLGLSGAHGFQTLTQGATDYCPVRCRSWRTAHREVLLGHR
jgi:hypothetical protein